MRRSESALNREPIPGGAHVRWTSRRSDGGRSQLPPINAEHARARLAQEDGSLLRAAYASSRSRTLSPPVSGSRVCSGSVRSPSLASERSLSSRGSFGSVANLKSSWSFREFLAVDGILQMDPTLVMGHTRHFSPRPSALPLPPGRATAVPPSAIPTRGAQPMAGAKQPRQSPYDAPEAPRWSIASASLDLARASAGGGGSRAAADAPGPALEDDAPAAPYPRSPGTSAELAAALDDFERDSWMLRLPLEPFAHAVVADGAAAARRRRRDAPVTPAPSESLSAALDLAGLGSGGRDGGRAPRVRAFWLMRGRLNRRGKGAAKAGELPYALTRLNRPGVGGPESRAACRRGSWASLYGCLFMTPRAVRSQVAADAAAEVEVDRASASSGGSPDQSCAATLPEPPKRALVDDAAGRGDAALDFAGDAVCARSHSAQAPGGSRRRASHVAAGSKRIWH